MKFVKKINNNVAFAKDETGIDYIVLGKGIGFDSTGGMIIPERKIDRMFKSETAKKDSNYITILTNMNSEIVDITTKISKYAEEQLGITFDNTHYLILADHLAYAIKRHKEGIDYAQLSQWELQKLYPKEYAVAVYAIEMINEHIGFELDHAEVAFITNHFVNANTKHSTLKDTLKMTDLIKRIVNLVEYQFQINLDENSFNYSKFISHLRYFILRKMNNYIFPEDSMDLELLTMFKMKYTEAYRMADKIEKYLQMKENWNLTPDEKLYLTVHVRRLTSNEE